jgi:hypothetical protein
MMMSNEIHTALADIKERLVRLESGIHRTARGRVNQRRAAEYLGKSREWIRLRHRNGSGPPRAADGSYSLDDLDEYAKGVP